MDCPPKKNVHCREMVVSGSSTVLFKLQKDIISQIYINTFKGGFIYMYTLAYNQVYFSV